MANFSAETLAIAKERGIAPEAAELLWRPKAVPAPPVVDPKKLTPTTVSTTFVTTAQDNIQGIDVYTTKRDTPINNLIDMIGAETSFLLKSISGMLPSIDLLDVVDGVSFALDSGPDGLRARIDDLAHEDWSSITKSVGAGMVSQMLSNVGITTVSPELLQGILGVPGSPPLGELLADNVPAVRVVMNGTVQSIINGDYKGAQGLSKMLLEVAGDTGLSQIFDVVAQSALFGTVVDTARSLGLTEVYQVVLDQYLDEQDQINFLLSTLEPAADACDIVFIGHAIDYCGTGRIMHNVPDVITRMLKGYKKTDPIASHHDAFLDTLACMMRINPTWDKTLRNGLLISDLTPFSTASADAISALEQFDLYRIPAAIALLYPTSSAVELGLNMWPVNTIQGYN